MKAWVPVAAVAAFGLLAGAAWSFAGDASGGSLVAITFIVSSVAGFAAVQIHRQGGRIAWLAGGLAGAAGTLAFYLGFYALDPPSKLGDAALIVGLFALSTGLIAAGGTRFLMNGVDRYRETHGLKHAPAR